MTLNQSFKFVLNKGCRVTYIRIYVHYIMYMYICIRIYVHYIMYVT